jgi:lysosomal acid lipase/cholesteryl ester hydrolase
MGYHDNPAMISFTLKHTGQKTLSYVGHSQGTTSMLYALTTDRLPFL